MSTLLSRDAFRCSVFDRDNHKCVNCGGKAQDAHHIIERRLWADGGYYLDNGASLCGPCHILAEGTALSCEEIREKAGITKSLLPPHLYPDQKYDKWGNPFLPDGRRFQGELYHDPSVQKILRQHDVDITHYVKYPRTYHLPWSPGKTKDDRVIKSEDWFEGREVVVTIKMDGENQSLYSDYLHARSIVNRKHQSRDWVKNFHSKIQHDIPDGWRVVLENLYAKHSIHYQHLEDYLSGISVWNNENVCLAWDETLEWFELLGITPVPVIWRGEYNREAIQSLHQDTYRQDECEGYVVRWADSFSYRDFSQAVAKYVRQGHVEKSHGHWMRSAFQINGRR